MELRRVVFGYNFGSPKDIEQVLTGSFDSPAIIATTALESTPPDKNAPSGTSEMSRTRTASRNRSINSAFASASLIGPVVANGKSQYSRGVGNGRPRSIRKVCAGGSLKTSRKAVRGSGT